MKACLSSTAVFQCTGVSGKFVIGILNVAAATEG